MRSFVSFLVQKGVVSSDVVREVLLNQAIRGGDIAINLLEMRAIKEATLVNLMAQYYRLLVVSIRDIAIVGEGVIRLIGKELAGNLKIVPFDVERENIYIACFEPPSKQDEGILKKVSGKTPRFFIASPVAIYLSLWTNYGIEFSQRIARIAGRINSEEENFLDDIIKKLSDDRKKKLEAIVVRKWEVFPVIEEKRLSVTTEESELEEEESFTGEGEEKLEENIFSKYIIIDRIGIKAPLSSERINKGAIEKIFKQETSKAYEGGLQVQTGVKKDEREKIETSTPFPLKPQVGFFTKQPLKSFTKDEIKHKIKNAEDAGEVVDVICEACVQIFEFVMAFRYKRGRFELYRAFSREWEFKVEEFPVKFIYSDHLPEPLLRDGSACICSLKEGDPIPKILSVCGRGQPKSGALFLPVMVGEKIAVVVYADNGEKNISLNEAQDIIVASKSASEKLLSLLVEKKKKNNS